MRRLTTRQNFALTFTLYVFGFLVVLYSLFYLVFSLMSVYQLRQDLSNDAKEIISNHLLLDKGEIIFRKDKTGASLKQFLLNENASALILDAKKSTVRSYGLFIYDNTILQPFINKVQASKKPENISVSLNKQKLEVIVVPLKTNGVQIGILVLGISVTDLYGFKQIMIDVFLLLGFLSVAGSFIVGYVLAGRTLTPLIKLAKVVEEMDFDRMESSLTVEGNPQDELVLLINRFNEMTIRLKDMASRQKEFVANASHELKTPLTRAITSLEVLPSSPETAAEIELIKGDLFQINALLDKLLLLTRLKKDSHSPNKNQSIKINRIFSIIKKQLEGKLKEKQITLTITSPEIIKTSIPFEYLEIILSNFISNAVKYSFNQKAVRVRVDQHQAGADIEIVDQGVGMTKEEAAHMFDRFYRGGANKEKGYGVGLSIVKQICDLYNIDIKVSSKKNRGTSIKISV